MEYPESSKALSVATKRASALAKEKKFNEAINVLDNLIRELPNYELDHSSVAIKIIPYFQKAGRYSEVEKYAENLIVPILKTIQALNKEKAHKIDSLEVAFSELQCSRVYDKLRLCAKREKHQADEKRFEEQSNNHIKNYHIWLEKGQVERKRKQRQDLIDVFGEDVSNWPTSLRHLY